MLFGRIEKAAMKSQEKGQRIKSIDGMLDRGQVKKIIKYEKIAIVFFLAIGCE